MPWASEQNAGYYTPQANGPILLANPSVVSPTAISAGSTWTSGLMNGDGFKAIAVGVTSSQPGALTVQRYLDMAGQVTQGGPVTQAITAGTAATINLVDGMPYATFSISITNTGGVGANITNFAALLAAN